MKIYPTTSGYQKPETTEISIIQMNFLCTSSTLGVETLVEDEETLSF